MQIAVMLNVIMVCNFMFSAVTQSVVLQSIIIESGIMLCVAILSVIHLNVVLASVVAPWKTIIYTKKKTIFKYDCLVQFLPS